MSVRMDGRGRCARRAGKFCDMIERQAPAREAGSPPGCFGHRQDAGCCRNSVANPEESSPTAFGMAVRIAHRYNRHRAQNAEPSVRQPCFANRVSHDFPAQTNVTI